MIPKVFGVGTHGPVVLNLKSFLAGQAFNPELRLGSGALYDDRVARALQEYQRRFDIPATGEIDPPTCDSMIRFFGFDLLDLAKNGGCAIVNVFVHDGAMISCQDDAQNGEPPPLLEEEPIPEASWLP